MRVLQKVGGKYIRWKMMNRYQKMHQNNYLLIPFCHNFFLKSVFLILNELGSDQERHLICWLATQMAAAAGTGPGQSRYFSRHCHGAAVTPTIGLSSAALPRPSAGNSVGKQSSRDLLQVAASLTMPQQGPAQHFQSTHIHTVTSRYLFWQYNNTRYSTGCFVTCFVTTFATFYQHFSVNKYKLTNTA